MNGNWRWRWRCNVALLGLWHELLRHLLLLLLLLLLVHAGDVGHRLRPLRLLVRHWRGVGSCRWRRRRLLVLRDCWHVN